MNQTAIDLITKLPDPGDRVWAIVVVFTGRESSPEHISTLPKLCVRRCTVDYLDIHIDKATEPIVKVEMRCDHGGQSVSAAPRDLFDTRTEAVKVMKRRYHT